MVVAYSRISYGRSSQHQQNGRRCVRTFATSEIVRLTLLGVGAPPAGLAIEAAAAALQQQQDLLSLEQKQILIPSPSTVEARKLERHYPHALKVKYKGS